MRWPCVQSPQNEEGISFVRYFSPPPIKIAVLTKRLFNCRDQTDHRESPFSHHLVKYYLARFTSVIFWRFAPCKKGAAEWLIGAVELRGKCRFVRWHMNYCQKFSL